MLMRILSPGDAEFFCVDASGLDGWLYLDAKRPHTHDVRTLLTLASDGEAPLLLSVRRLTTAVMQCVCASCRGAT